MTECKNKNITSIFHMCSADGEAALECIAAPAIWQKRAVPLAKRPTGLAKK